MKALTSKLGKGLMILACALILMSVLFKLTESGIYIFGFLFNSTSHIGYAIALLIIGLWLWAISNQGRTSPSVINFSSAVNSGRSCKECNGTGKTNQYLNSQEGFGKGRCYGCGGTGINR